MKKTRICLLFFYVLFIGAIQKSKAYTIDKTPYRIAASHDGNEHDLDDITAAPMVIALLSEAGVQAKLVHMDYNNHLQDHNDGTGIIDGKNCGDPDLMIESVEGACEKWGVSKDIVFNVMKPTELTKAIANFKKEAELSTADNRLYYACGGPMEVPYQCISAVSAEKRQFITVVSHSDWNENHAGGEGNHKLADIHALGCKIVCQRGGDNAGLPGVETMYGQNGQGFNDSDISKYHWLRDMGGKYAWLFNRNQFDFKWDASDAGMVWYIITGDDQPTEADIEHLFKNGDEEAPTKPGAPTASNATKTSVDLSWAASSDNVAVTKYNILLNGSVVAAVSGTSATIDGLWCGKTYTFTVQAKDGSGNDSELSDGTEVSTLECEGNEQSALPILVGENYIVFEAESTDSPLGGWKIVRPGDEQYKDSQVSPINNTHLEYQGGGGDLSYTFVCPKTAKYRLGMRMWQNKKASDGNDANNDVWIKMAGDFTSACTYSDNELKEKLKFFGRGTPDWGACYKGDHHETGNHVVVYNLIEGKEYTFTMSGRSEKTNIDYIILIDASVSYTLGAYQDIAALNDEKYRPDYNPPPANIEVNAVDCKYTGIDGFTDAKADNKAGKDILSIPARLEWAAAQYTYTGDDGQAWFEINAMQEQDGESTFILKINGVEIGRGTNDKIFGSNIRDYTIQTHQIKDVNNKVDLKNGDLIQIEFNNATNGEVPEGNDGLTATSRGRWVSFKILFSEEKEENEEELDPLKISESSILLQVGDKKELSPVFTEAYFGDSVVTWSSTEPSVASIVNGTVTASAKGSAIIYLTDGFDSAKCYVAVVEEGQRVYMETFDNNTKMDWGDPVSFTGNHGFEWTLGGKGKEANDAFFTTKSVYLNIKGDGAKLWSGPISGGVTYLKLKCKAFVVNGNGNYERILQVKINDQVYTNKHSGEEIYDFIIDDLNVEGSFTIEIENKSVEGAPAHIAIDEIMWFPYEVTNITNNYSEINENVYPNPFTTSLQVKLNSNNYSKVQLLDIRGRLVETHDVKGQGLIAISPSYQSAPAGLYFVKFIGDENTNVLKVIRK